MLQLSALLSGCVPVLATRAPRFTHVTGYYRALIFHRSAWPLIGELNRGPRSDSAGGPVEPYEKTGSPCKRILLPPRQKGFERGKNRSAALQVRKQRCHADYDGLATSDVHPASLKHKNILIVRGEAQLCQSFC